MSLKSMAFALAVVGTLGVASYASPASARVVVSVALPTQAPPPLRVERRGHERRGQVWIPGYWRWAHGRYVWSRGHWVRARAGYRYEPARWEACGPHWCLKKGHWDH